MHCPQVVEFGRFEMDTWYYSPYPEPYASQHKLYVCEYTLKYFRKKKTLLRHLAKLDVRHPPGEQATRGGAHALNTGLRRRASLRTCPVASSAVDK